MSTINLTNFKWGLNLTDAQIIDDNQFATLKNMYYDKDKRLRTRRWTATFGKPIPDAVVALNDMDATTNWTAALDATSLATTTAIRGTNALDFTIDVSNDAWDAATLTNASIWTVDISTAKWYIWLWYNVPSWFNTNLTQIEFKVGSDSSNYYSWTSSTLTEWTSTFLPLLFDDATSTWTPVDTTIDYFQFNITYSSSYTDQTAVTFDDINAYSASSSLPVTSYFFFQRDDTLVRTAIAAVWTNMFHYDETSTYWDLIKTSLTQFETATWRTTERTRWSFAVYRNIIYMCNWVDNYMDFNWVVATEYAWQPNFRYLLYVSDRIIWAWDDSNPSTLYYDNTAQADAQTPNANSVVVWWDELWEINWLHELWALILAFKDKKVYSINLSTPSATWLDTQNGWYSSRTIENVWNSLFYFTDEWVNFLKQRNWVSWSAAIESQPLTEDLREFINDITPKQYNANAWHYIKSLNNYYFSFNTLNDNIPNKTIVYSSLIWKSWSEYTYQPIYDYWFYIDTNGVVRDLIATLWWQMVEIETWFDDLWIEILHELTTKEYDFWDISVFKSYNSVDISWLKNEGSTINIELFVDWETVNTYEITDTQLDIDITAITIWTKELWTGTIWWWEWTWNDIDLFPYKIRLPLFYSWSKIQIKMSSEAASTVWTLDKMRMDFTTESMDIFPTANLG